MTETWIIAIVASAGFICQGLGFIGLLIWHIRGMKGELNNKANLLTQAVEHLDKNIARLADIIEKTEKKVNDHETRLTVVEKARDRNT